MEYFRIQFPPYESLKKNYLRYKLNDGFVLAGRAAASIFSEQSMSDEGLCLFLSGKSYRVIETTSSTDIYGVFKFRGTK